MSYLLYLWYLSYRISTIPSETEWNFIIYSHHNNKQYVSDIMWIVRKRKSHPQNLNWAFLVFNYPLCLVNGISRLYLDMFKGDASCFTFFRLHSFCTSLQRGTWMKIGIMYWNWLDSIYCTGLFLNVLQLIWKLFV